MDVSATLDAPCSPEVLFAEVDDLSTYPGWLDLVARAEAEAGSDPAWRVDLRARIGPLARSKRLRMVRTVHEAPTHVRFERAEADGRSHSTWVLDAEVRATATGSHLLMRLHYGGLLGPVVERLLGDEVERATPRLSARVGGR